MKIYIYIIYIYAYIYVYKYVYRSIRRSIWYKFCFVVFTGHAWVFMIWSHLQLLWRVDGQNVSIADVDGWSRAFLVVVFRCWMMWHVRLEYKLEVYKYLIHLLFCIFSLYFEKSPTWHKKSPDPSPDSPSTVLCCILLLKPASSPQIPTPKITTGSRSRSSSPYCGVGTWFGQGRVVRPWSPVFSPVV